MKTLLDFPRPRELDEREPDERYYFSVFPDVFVWPLDDDETRGEA